MKKLVLLMILILIAIFIFSPPTGAINLIPNKTEPEAVPICDTITFNWSFFIPPPIEEDYYIFKIYDPDKMIVLEERFPINLGERYISDNHSWHVPEGSSSGRYIAEIRHSSGHPSATEPFRVGPTGNLTIHKFYDRNQNKIRDDDEMGLHGWNFTIQYIDDPRVKPVTITTEAGGTYTHPRLAVGNYSITEKKEEKGRCWMSTTPLSQKAVVRESRPAIVNFGNYEVGTLEIIKFNDTDNDGIRDPAKEEGLSNWGFSVKFPNETSTDVETGEDGTYNLSNVPVGTYEITEKMTEERKKEGWIATTPITQVKVLKPCSTEEVEFGNHFEPPQPGKVFILKFNDTNRNGIQDDGESPISNWGFRIRIKDSSGSVIIRHTDEHGKIIQELASNAKYVHRTGKSYTSGFWELQTIKNNYL
jgi:hypothetical protein